MRLTIVASSFFSTANSFKKKPSWRYFSQCDYRGQLLTGYHLLLRPSHDASRHNGERCILQQRPIRLDNWAERPRERASDECRAWPVRCTYRAPNAHRPLVMGQMCTLRTATAHSHRMATGQPCSLIKPAVITVIQFPAPGMWSILSHSWMWMYIEILASKFPGL